MLPHRIGLSLTVLVVLSQTVACRGASSSVSATMPLRLVDTFDARLVSGGATATRTLQRTEFRFSDPSPSGSAGAPATRANAGPGVADLSVRDGLLVGRGTDDFPMVHIERTSGLDNPDTLHAIEIRLRSSAGGNLWIQTVPGVTVDLADQRQRTRNGFPWPMQSPLKAGAEMQTYIVTPSASTPMSRVRHILIRPTDAAGATFSIESVRLVTRAEHLAAIPSGVGWQGLSEIYRESLVARAPETITYNLDLPDRPWFDVAVGTIEDGPVTFRVSAKAPDASDESQTVAVEYTVTRPHRWSVFPIDLTPLAGRAATLRLELRSETTGAVGFWGAPVIRERRAASGASAEASGAPPQGVILIHADTLRRDHLNFYGHTRETAPFLARLAKEGVRFNHAISPASWTKVATPSIQTGLYPTTHGVRVASDRLPSSATTIAEVYRAAGYATFATSSVLFTGLMTNLHQGYEELHENGSLSSQGTPLSSKTSREYVDRLTEWLDRHREVPFFAYLHVFDPHSPYEPYAPYDAMWGDAPRREEHRRQRQQVTKFIADPAMRGRQLPSRQELLKAGLAPEPYVEQLTDWYDGSIRALDVEIARLFEHLRRLGLDERTLVALTSDHGTEFHDHGRFFHGQTVYGELINIPLLIRWPGRVASGRAIDELVQSLDVMPTLLNLSGLAVPDAVQGQSLLPFVGTAPPQGGAWPGWKPRPAIAERFPSVPNPTPDESRVSHAIIEGNWKLIHNTTTEPGLDEFELFDYFKDPLNKQNVAADHPEVVARLAKAIAGWRQMATAARLKPDAETTKGLSAEELQRLRSLGYVR